MSPIFFSLKNLYAVKMSIFSPFFTTDLTLKKKNFLIKNNNYKEVCFPQLLTKKENLPSFMKASPSFSLKNRRLNRMVSKWGRSYSTHTSNWTVEAFFDLRFSNEMKNVGKMEERGYDIKIESVAKKKYTSPSKKCWF